MNNKNSIAHIIQITEFVNKLVKAEQGHITRIGKGGSAADKARKEQFETYLKAQKWLSEDKKDIREGNWSAKEVECLNSLMLITAKPVVYLVRYFLYCDFS